METGDCRACSGDGNRTHLQQRTAYHPSGKLIGNVPYLLPRPASIIPCQLLLAAITAAVIWSGGRKKYFITGWFWYLLSLIPVIGIIQVGSQAHADRYTYIPLIGVFIIIAWSVRAITDTMTGRNNLGILLAEMGRTDEAIVYYRRTLELEPDAITTLQNLVFALAEKKQWTDATSTIRNALVSAKAAGNEAHMQAISRIMTNLNETIKQSRAR